jgi:deazaflavin-dependent oxidoreductase (nitroreductase family)
LRSIVVQVEWSSVSQLYVSLVLTAPTKRRQEHVAARPDLSKTSPPVDFEIVYENARISERRIRGPRLQHARRPRSLLHHHDRREERTPDHDTVDVPYGEGVLLIASQGGAPRNPVWYGNLVKHPDIDVRHRGRRMKLHARLATAEEKPGLWPICDEHYPPYADYRARTTRDIPIFVCEPRG